MLRTELRKIQDDLMGDEASIELLCNISKQDYEQNQQTIINILKRRGIKWIKLQPERLIKLIRIASNYSTNELNFYLTVFGDNLKDLPAEALNNFYTILVSDVNSDLYILRGYIMGHLSLFDRKIIFQSITTNKTKSDNEKFELIIAINIFIFHNSLKRGNLSNAIVNYMIECSRTTNEDLSYHTVSSFSRLFNLHPRKIIVALRHYFHKSQSHKFIICDILDIQYIFYGDKNFIRALLSDLFLQVKNGSDEDLLRFTHLLMNRLERLSLDPNSKNYLKIYQRMSIRLLKTFFERDPKILQNMDEFIQINSDINLSKVVSYLDKSIIMLQADKEVFAIYERFVFPQIITSIFVNHKDKYFDYILDLQKDNRSLSRFCIKEMVKKISDNLDNLIRRFNNLIKDIQLHCSVNDQELIEEFQDTQDINLINTKIEKLQILLESIPREGIKQKELTQIKNEFEKLNLIFPQEMDFLHRIEDLLFNEYQNKNIHSDKLTASFRANTIKTRSIRCNILLNNFSEAVKLQLDYSLISKNIAHFPNIQKFFGLSWFKKEYDKGFPYHPLLMWLNNEFVDYDKSSENSNFSITENTKMNAYALIANLDKCLSVFSEGKMQGFKTIMNNLKQQENYLQAQSHLQLANQLNHSYEILLEEQLLPNKPVDIVISNGKDSMAIEVIKLDSYAALRHIGFARGIPDRPRDKLVEKGKQMQVIAEKTKLPVIVAMDVTDSPESDINGIFEAFYGKFIDHRIVISPDKYSNGKNMTIHTTAEPDELTYRPEIQSISAVILFSVNITTDGPKFRGTILSNNNSSKKLEPAALNKLKQMLFG